MENLLDFELKLTLKEMSLRRSAINLWNEPNILVSIEKFSTVSGEGHGNNLKKWRETVESKVADKVTKLVLPTSVTKQLLLYVTPIGLEIEKWKRFHEDFLEVASRKNTSDSRVEFDAAVLAKLYWTAAGKIDYRKSAEKLMLCEMLSILNRYILACLYCLEDHVPVFWEKLPEEIQKEFYNETDTWLEGKGLNLEFCWPYILKREQPKLDRIMRRHLRKNFSFNLIAFADSACCGNKAAIEYFFLKLKDSEKEYLDIATRLAITRECRDGFFHRGNIPFGSFSDGVCYLLSSMTREEQMTIFETKHTEILRCFLDWPWQDVFLKILDLVWRFFSQQHYDNLLRVMHLNFEESHYYLPEFFQQFFMQSPMEFRKLFVDRECRLGDFFREFFNVQDLDTIQVIFRNIEAADRMRLVSCAKVLELFCDAVLKDRWHMVEVCLREATLSKEDRESLKKVFFSVLKRTDRGRFAWRRRNRFCQLLDEIGASAQTKRSLEDETLDKAKKFCTTE